MQQVVNNIVQASFSAFAFTLLSWALLMLLHMLS